MPIVFRSLDRSRNHIRFGSRLGDQALRELPAALNEVAERRFTTTVLDLRRVERAFADSVLPLIVTLDERKARGMTFRLLLPDDAGVRKLFLNSNWAHFIDPEHPLSSKEHPQHVAARRYESHPEQQTAVSDVLDAVLRTMDLRRDVISALEWTVNEITDNVLNHSQSPSGGLVQLSTLRDSHLIKFVVADGGRGIPAAMRDAYPALDDREALVDSVKPGVTSIPESGQGNGLAGSLRIATYAEGSFKIASGRAQLSVFKDERSREYRTQGKLVRGQRYPGTVVMMELSTAAEFSIGEALALDGRVRSIEDVVDIKYGSESGDLMLHVAAEALGVGTRHAGVELRRKATNLLNAEPTKRLVLDWSGLTIVSSSFADEAVGKLFVELGPTTFSARVSHSGTEPLVRSLLDRAVMQRVVQSMGIDPEP